MPSTIQFPIIGIGASAGGLEPLETFFENVSLKSGFAYVVIQHLAPNHKSLMDELLARHTVLPIKVIEDGMLIEKNTIYLNPPKKFVEIHDTKFVLSEKEDRKLSFPISTFFESLAEKQLEKVAGIILSGTGSDGTEGIKYIKEKGGFVLAQQPDSAKFNGMPKNAILTGAVDMVCEVEEMPSELNSFFGNKNIFSTALKENHTDKEIINSIIDEVNNQTGVDFSEYKMTTVLRRINRRIGILGYQNLDEYLSYISSNSGEGHQLAKELLIGVTRFFRDQEAFNYLENKVIPNLVDQNNELKRIRIWIPACSTGEEAYSIAILMKDYLRRNQLRYDVTIFATDLDKEAIKKATHKTFPESIVNEVPSHYLNSYFTPNKSGYSIAKDIREMIIFSVHNIIQDPPFSKIDLISCRNFLIYVNNDLQQNLFGLFQYALKDNAYLFLGSSESLGDASVDYAEVSSKYKVYRNKNSRKLINFKRKKPAALSYTQNKKAELSTINQQFATPTQTKRRRITDVQNYLIQHYVPDTIIFDENFEIVHTTGNVNQWLKLPVGEIDTNVLRMLPEQLTLSFELLANKVLSSEKPVQLKNFETDSVLQMFFSELIDIEIKLLPEKGNLKLLAASFSSANPKKQKDTNENYELDLSRASKEKINILERELRINKENLQTTIEELESSNEELQAANEELQSSNEELESVNEELYTVNSEYQEKVEELTETNNDLNNLIKSTDIAILFLDENLHIRRFTPAIKKILNLLPHDIGRHISHFRSKFEVNDLMHQIEMVFEKLIPFETTIKDLNDQEYIMQISPFKTLKNEIKGIVLSFVDITQVAHTRKRLELSKDAIDNVSQELEKQAELFELIAQNANDMISIHDIDSCKFEYISPSAEEVTGFSTSYLRGRKTLDFIPDRKHKTAWEKAITKLKNKQNTTLIQYQFKTKTNAHRWFETSLKHIVEPSGEVRKFLATTRDVTHNLSHQQEMKKLSLIAEQTSNAVLITDTDGKITFANDAFEKMTGYTEYEVLNKIPGSFLQGEETNTETVEEMRTSIAHQKPFDVEVINYTKHGQKYWIKIQCEPMFDDNHELIGFFSIQSDITQKKDYESKIQILTNTLSERNEKLKSMNQSLDEFAYVASHDLKAPLRNIMGMISILKQKGNKLSPEKQVKYFDILYDAADELSRLIDSLLTYSRSGTLNEELQKTNLEDVFANLKTIFKKPLEELNGKIEIELAVKEAVIYPILFKRLFTNLIQNAIKYRSEDPISIKISAIEKNKQYIFSVSDNGIGIDPQMQDRIFKIFTTLKQNKESNGIGLSVCKKIAELHQGNISVESKLGEGSTFIVEIPKL